MLAAGILQGWAPCSLKHFLPWTFRAPQARIPLLLPGSHPPSLLIPQSLTAGVLRDSALGRLPSAGCPHPRPILRFKHHLQAEDLHWSSC